MLLNKSTNTALEKNMRPLNVFSIVLFIKKLLHKVSKQAHVARSYMLACDRLLFPNKLLNQIPYMKLNFKHFKIYLF